jgi:undecaprenyl phosphate-alpha-L-ara4N flippase subunit ArnE
MSMIALTILLRSLAAACAKQAALSSAGHGLFAMIANGWLVAEVAALGLQAITWAFVLRRHALSVAYPFISLVFAVNVAMAHFIFHETIRPQHLLGITIILIGVAIVAAPAGHKQTSETADAPA